MVMAAPEESQRQTAVASVVPTTTSGTESSATAVVTLANSEPLPRIAEEKDSPTSTQDSSSVSEGFMPAIEEYGEGESSSSPTQTLEKPTKVKATEQPEMEPAGKTKKVDQGELTSTIVAYNTNSLDYLTFFSHFKIRKSFFFRFPMDYLHFTSGYISKLSRETFLNLKCLYFIDPLETY